MRKESSLLLILLAYAGCKSETTKLDQLPPDSAAITPATPIKAVDSRPDYSSWKISVQGLGPLHTGMSLAEVRALVPKLSGQAGAETAECTYARSPSLPDGVSLMFAKGTLARVDIVSGSVKSDLGARIGDTEDQIKMLYGSSVKVTPHKYTDGHYMTVRSPADSSARIVFETDGSKVIRFRSGGTPEVEFIEGCS